MKIFFVLLFIWSFSFSSQKFDETYKDYKDGKYVKAFKNFKYLASEHKDLEASYVLAKMYERGEACNVNTKEALKWYKFAATGYYEQSTFNPTREIDKERDKIYESLNQIEDKETQKTIKRHTDSLYNIKAYKTNYFLPISHRINGNYAPTNAHIAKNIETEFQLSIKYDITSDLLGLGEIYTIGYTQLAFWQLYADSAYFRETNYNPELFVSVPFLNKYNNEYIKGLRFSLAHQSNGRGGVEERSWNSLNASVFFQYKYLFTEFKLWHRLKDSTDYNPSLIDYIGYGHIKFTLPYKKHMAQLLLRNNFSGKTATEFNYSYPILGRDDLFLYVKYFNGYGESLIDYNHNINKIGVGFSISR